MAIDDNFDAKGEARKALSLFMKPIAESAQIEKPDKIFSTALLRILSSDPERLIPLVEGQNLHTANCVAHYLRYIADRIEDGKWPRGSPSSYVERQEIGRFATLADERYAAGEGLDDVIAELSTVLAAHWGAPYKANVIAARIVEVRKRRARIKKAESGK